MSSDPAGYARTEERDRNRKEKESGKEGGGRRDKGVKGGQLRVSVRLWAGECTDVVRWSCRSNTAV